MLSDTEVACKAAPREAFAIEPANIAEEKDANLG
jgi:hypothetical protein